jgi:microcystin-dependent protein
MSNARAIADLGTASGGLAPSGVVLPYAGAAAPAGWLLCAGQAVSRTTYATLFTALSTTYGAGDGTTTFNLPDLRGRIPGGKDDMGGAAAGRLTTAGSGVNGALLGASGGAQTHTLDISQMPSHGHVQNHTGSGASAQIPQGGGGAGTTSSGISTAGAGGGLAHNNTQPTLVLNYIIKT